MSTAKTVGPLPLTAVFNFRDLGGLPTIDGATVRSGVVHRADGLHRLVDSDVELLAPLGLRTVIDLRTDREVIEWGHAPVEVTGAEVIHRSILRTTWDAEALTGAEQAERFLADRYLDMLDEGGEAIADVLDVIADPARHGVVFHCAAGKDRTGVIAALILSLLGVDDDVIAADYGRSADAMDRMEGWYRDNHPDRVEAMSRQPRSFRSCPPAAMLAFLGDVRSRWGSVQGCVDELGVDSSTTESLRQHLLVR